MNSPETYSLADTFSLSDGEFHSCIIMGYSIDMLFFDTVVWPQLRRAGITNLVILVDQESLIKSYCNTKLLNDIGSKYTVISVPVDSGKFHSKMILALGEKNGMLSIGSGNPTHGGYISNLESWMTYYYQDGSTGTGGLFSDVWNYIETIQKQIRGVALTQLKWAKKYSPWLSTGEIINRGGKKVLSDKSTVQFFSNIGTGIFTSLIEALPENISEITMVSPFYGDSPKVLQTISETYPHAKIHICIQQMQTQANIKTLQSLPHNVHFFTLGSTSKNVDVSKRFIHAKFIQVKTAEGIFLLLGSPNCTLSALGTKKIRPRNNEIALLVGDTKKRDYFSELGLIKEKDISRTDLADTIVPSDKMPASDEQNSQCIIVWIEKRGGIFEVFAIEELPLKIELCLSENGSEIFASFNESRRIASEEHFVVSFAPSSSFQDREKPCIGFIKNTETGIIISNKCIINRSDVILRHSNPDPQRKRLSEIIEEVTLDLDGRFDRLLDLLNFDKFPVVQSTTIARHSKENEFPNENTGEYKEVFGVGGRKQSNESETINLYEIVRLFKSMLVSDEHDSNQQNNIDQEESTAHETGIAPEQSEEDTGNYWNSSENQLKSLKKFLKKAEKLIKAALPITLTDDLAAQRLLVFCLFSMEVLLKSYLKNTTDLSDTEFVDVFKYGSRNLLCGAFSERFRSRGHGSDPTSSGFSDAMKITVLHGLILASHTVFISRDKFDKCRFFDALEAAKNNDITVSEEELRSLSSFLYNKFSRDGSKVITLSVELLHEYEKFQKAEQLTGWLRNLAYSQNRGYYVC